MARAARLVLFALSAAVLASCGGGGGGGGSGANNNGPGDTQPPSPSRIVTSDVSFTVIFDDGSARYYGPTLVQEGRPVRTTIPSNGNPIVKVFNNAEAFAAIRKDGTVTAWGNAAKGGDSSAISGAVSPTNPVASIHSNANAFAAVRQDGSVLTWGDAAYGGNSSSVAGLLTNVVSVTGTKEAFAALRMDGSVVTWGNPGAGGNSSSISTALNGTVPVTKIFSTWGAFAALRSDGSVVTWGNADSGGNSATVAAGLDGTNDVVSIASTANAFAALRVDGSVVTWGSNAYGGDSSAVQSSLFSIAKIFATDGAFAALRQGGFTVVTWGNPYFGGNSSYYSVYADGSVPAGGQRLVAITSSSPVTNIYSTKGAFLAVRQDTSFRTWGQTFYGARAEGIGYYDGPLGGTTDGVVTTGFGFMIGYDGKVLRWNELDGGGQMYAHYGCDMNCRATAGAVVGLSQYGKLQTLGSPNFGADPDLYAKLAAIGTGSYTLDNTTALPSICINFQPDTLSAEESGTCYSDGHLTRWLTSVGFTRVWSTPRKYLTAIKMNPDGSINAPQTQAAIDAIADAAIVVKPANPLVTATNPAASYTSIGSLCSTCGNFMGEINKLSIMGGFGPIF